MRYVAKMGVYVWFLTSLLFMACTPGKSGTSAGTPAGPATGTSRGELSYSYDLGSKYLTVTNSRGQNVFSSGLFDNFLVRDHYFLAARDKRIYIYSEAGELMSEFKNTDRYYMSNSMIGVIHEDGEGEIHSIHEKALLWNGPLNVRNTAQMSVSDEAWGVVSEGYATVGNKRGEIIYSGTEASNFISVSNTMWVVGNERRVVIKNLNGEVIYRFPGGAQSGQVSDTLWGFRTSDLLEIGKYDGEKIYHQTIVRGGAFSVSDTLWAVSDVGGTAVYKLNHELFYHSPEQCRAVQVSRDAFIHSTDDGLVYGTLKGSRLVGMTWAGGAENLALGEFDVELLKPLHPVETRSRR